MSAYKWLPIVAVALLATVRGASAQTPSGLAAMAFFDGAWTCKRLSSPVPGAAGSIFAFNGGLEKDGRWNVLAFDDGQLDVTYDAVTKRLIFMYLGNTGEYGMLTSAGWQNNVMHLNDAVTSNGEPLGSATFTRRSPNAFTSIYSVTTPAGRVTYSTICSRK